MSVSPSSSQDSPGRRDEAQHRKPGLHRDDRPVIPRLRLPPNPPAPSHVGGPAPNGQPHVTREPRAEERDHADRQQPEGYKCHRCLTVLALRGRIAPMPATIAPERPDTPDALRLIDELQTHLESFYPPESRHGFSVERLIKEGVAFFV